MKITNITNKTIKPVPVSIMVTIQGKDSRIELKPGESVFSNGEFNSLFNKSLRVQKQKGLIDVVDENGVEPILVDLKLDSIYVAPAKKEDDIKKPMINAFDNPDLLIAFEPQQHPDLLIVNTKKEIDYSSNIVPEEPEPETTEPAKDKKSKKKKDQ